MYAVYPRTGRHTQDDPQSIPLLYTSLQIDITGPERAPAPLQIHPHPRSSRSVFPILENQVELTERTSQSATLHPSTLAIATMLNIDFNFPRPNRRQRASTLPELTLISLLVIATKLYHPFNNATRPRHATSLTDPAIMTINWPAWVKAHDAHHARLNPADHLPRGTELNVTEEHAMSMTGQQLDEYMDFYERTFIDEERAETKKKALPKQLLDMFPTGRPDGSTPAPYSYTEQTAQEQLSHSEKLASVVGSFQVRPIATHKNMDNNETESKMGSFYKRYRRVDELEGHARVFHEKVAEAAAIRLETLLVVVGQMERRLIVWRDARVKEGLGSEDDDSDDSDDDGDDDSD